MPARPSASMRLDMSRPVLMTQLRAARLQRADEVLKLLRDGRVLELGEQCSVEIG